MHLELCEIISFVILFLCSCIVYLISRACDAYFKVHTPWLKYGNIISYYYFLPPTTYFLLVCRVIMSFLYYPYPAPITSVFLQSALRLKIAFRKKTFLYLCQVSVLIGLIVILQILLQTLEREVDSLSPLKLELSASGTLLTRGWLMRSCFEEWKQPGIKVSQPPPPPQKNYFEYSEDLDIRFWLLYSWMNTEYIIIDGFLLIQPAGIINWQKCSHSHQHPAKYVFLESFSF